MKPHLQDESRLEFNDLMFLDNFKMLYRGQVKRLDDGMLQRHGFGMHTTDIETYIGQYNEDNFHGTGSLINETPGGATEYIGDFVKGGKGGRGTLTQPDWNYTYYGEWRNNCYHGEGKLTNGIMHIIWEGVFENQ